MILTIRINLFSIIYIYIYTTDSDDVVTRRTTMILSQRRIHNAQDARRSTRRTKVQNAKAKMHKMQGNPQRGWWSTTCATIVGKGPLPGLNWTSSFWMLLWCNWACLLGDVSATALDIQIFWLHPIGLEPKGVFFYKNPKTKKNYFWC